jgi:anti-sigma B factor antagonist
MRPLKTREVDGVLIVTLEESTGINDGQSDAYRQKIYEAVEDLPRPRVAIDLAPIDFLSSSGVAMLIGLRRRVAAAQGALVLFGLHPYVQDLLKVMKILPLFRVAVDEPGALALLSPTPAA